MLPILQLVQAPALTLEALPSITSTVAQQWFLWTIAVVVGRVAYLVWAHNFRTAMIWFVKLITDPLTDIAAYVASPFSAYKAFLPSQAHKSATK